MIQRYLELLSDEQLTRVIEGPMRPGAYLEIHDTNGIVGGPCFVGTAEVNSGVPAINALCRQLDKGRIIRADLGKTERVGRNFRSVEMFYDRLCARYGIEVINDAIRLKAIKLLAARKAAQKEVTSQPQQEKAFA